MFSIHPHFAFKIFKIVQSELPYTDVLSSGKAGDSISGILKASILRGLPEELVRMITSHLLDPRGRLKCGILVNLCLVDRATSILATRCLYQKIRIRARANARTIAHLAWTLLSNPQRAAQVEEFEGSFISEARHLDPPNLSLILDQTNSDYKFRRRGGLPQIPEGQRAAVVYHLGQMFPNPELFEFWYRRIFVQQRRAALVSFMILHMVNLKVLRLGTVPSSHLGEDINTTWSCLQEFVLARNQESCKIQLGPLLEHLDAVFFTAEPSRYSSGSKTDPNPLQILLEIPSLSKVGTNDRFWKSSEGRHYVAQVPRRSSSIEHFLLADEVQSRWYSELEQLLGISRRLVSLHLSLYVGVSDAFYINETADTSVSLMGSGQKVAHSTKCESFWQHRKSLKILSLTLDAECWRVFYRPVEARSFVNLKGYSSLKYLAVAARLILSSKHRIDMQYQLLPEKLPSSLEVLVLTEPNGMGLRGCEYIAAISVALVNLLEARKESFPFLRSIAVDLGDTPFDAPVSDKTVWLKPCVNSGVLRITTQDVKALKKVSSMAKDVGVEFRTHLVAKYWNDQVNSAICLPKQ